MKVIFGTGLLAQSIQLNSPIDKSKLIQRRIYTNWYHDRDISGIESYFNSIKSENIEVYLCFGATNSKISKEELIFANYELPLFIIDSVKKFSNKIVTFGTIQELLNTNLNNYTQSKYKFFNEIEARNWLDRKLLHVRLHTIYGGKELKPATFVGQIIEHISNLSIFKMSSGEQIREYHHINDTVQILDRILEMNLQGPIEISHGKPFKLSLMASHIFEKLNLSNLLLINENERIVGENYNKVFETNQITKNYNFIDPLKGIFSYVKQQLGYKF